jgi:hypothetical protein
MGRITGKDKIIKQLRSIHGKKAEAFSRGIKKAGLLLFSVSQTRVPVQFGNLKASGFVRSEGNGIDTVVIVGYTASYALYVHENVQAAHGTEFNQKHQVAISNDAHTPSQQAIWFERGPLQTAKFLEGPSREPLVRNKMVEIVKMEMQS